MLTASGASVLRRSAEWSGVATLYLVGAIAVTWPLVTHLGTGVNDFGDPLLNAWTLAWVAHQGLRAPWRLFDAPIFYPEHATLAYSEPLLVPAFLVSPVWWATHNAVLCHNLSLLSGYVLSGVGMYGLVRHLTHHRVAALVAGLAFTLYPYRADHVPRMQLELTYWMPVALWLLHRWLDAPRVRRAVGVGTALGAQVLSCLYYGVFFATVFIPVAAALTWHRRVAWRIAWRHGLAAAVALTLTTGWLVLPFLQARAQVGERPYAEIAAGGARVAHYADAHPRSVVHGRPSAPGEGELRLFPGWTLLGLAGVGATGGTTAFVYLGATVLAFDLSRGFDGLTYEPLYRLLLPYRGLRVPARAGMLVGLGLCILGGFGLARLLRGRSRWVQGALLTGALAGLVADSAMRPLPLSEVPAKVPAIYAWLADQPPGVIVEYPVGPLEGRIGPQDPTYMLGATHHWRPMLNGYSGFVPHSYVELVHVLEGFPAPHTLAYLRARGAAYLLVHERFYGRHDYRTHVRQLDAAPDLAFRAAFRDADGRESRVYRVRH